MNSILVLEKSPDQECMGTRRKNSQMMCVILINVSKYTYRQTYTPSKDILAFAVC